MKYTFFFTLLCCVTMASAYAQSYPLEGAWKLESASVLKITGTDTVEVSVDAVREEVADMLAETLEFKADSLIFPDRTDCQCGSRGRYERTGNQIQISFTAAPIRILYRIESEQLHFSQQMPWSTEPPLSYQVFTIYSKQP